MGVVERQVGRVEALDDLEPLHEGRPGPPAVEGLVDAAARHGEVEVRRVARVDEDRVELRPVRRAVLDRSHPRPELRVVVDGGERLPGDAAVVGAEEPLRRRPGVPGTRLGRMAGREPERVVDGAAVPLALRERGWPGRLLPGPAEVGGTEDGRTQVPGLRGRQQRAPVARVEHEVAEHVAEEVRAVDPPGPPRRVAAKEPRPLAGGDEQQHAHHPVPPPSDRARPCPRPSAVSA